MGSVNLDNTGSGSAITLSSDGTSLLLDGTAVGGGGADLYAAETTGSSAPSAGGTRSLAIGSGASSAGSEAISIGVGADAQGNSSVAIGDGAVAGTFSVAIGWGTADTGSNNTLIGRISASTYRQSQTIIGHNADGGDYQIGNTAVGYEAKAMASYSTALSQSYASGQYSFAAAIANNTSSYGATTTNAIAMGNLSKASSASGAIAIGNGNISSGDGAVIGGHLNNSAATGSFIGGGKSNVIGVDAQYSRVGGYQGKAVSPGQDVYSGGNFAAVGDAQRCTYILRSDTTDATAEQLTSTNGTASTWNKLNLPNNSAYFFSGTIIARQDAATGTDVGAWEIKGAIRREANAASTVLINSTIDDFNVPTGWAVALTADTTNGGLAITVTGAAATNIRWVATVNTSEVTY